MVLLHGYGGDGKDISMLIIKLEKTHAKYNFICPNGHEPCEINPSRLSMV